MAVYLAKGWKLSAASVNPHTRLLSELSADHLRTVAQQASCSRRGQTLLTEMHALAADFKSDCFNERLEKMSLQQAVEMSDTNNSAHRGRLR